MCDIKWREKIRQTNFSSQLQRWRAYALISTALATWRVYAVLWIMQKKTSFNPRQCRHTYAVISTASARQCFYGYRWRHN